MKQTAIVSAPCASASAITSRAAFSSSGRIISPWADIEGAKRIAPVIQVESYRIYAYQALAEAGEINWVRQNSGQLKALDDQTIATDLISGASILGDGRVVLIVNVPAIVERHSQTRPQQEEGVVSGILLSHADRKNASASPSEVRP